MYRLLVSLILMFTAGCATTAKYEANLNSWIGHSEQELVAAWGIPSQSYALGSGKAISYQRAGNAQKVGQPMGNSYVVNTYQAWCETTFQVDSLGTIKNWNWRGNACRSE